MSRHASLPALPRISPGTFVRLQRQARRLSLETVAMMIETSPDVSTQRRVEWLAAIENDAAPISLPVAWALHDTIGLDLRTLSYWMAIAEGIRPTLIVTGCDLGSGHAA